MYQNMLTTFVLNGKITKGAVEHMYGGCDVLTEIELPEGIVLVELVSGEVIERPEIEKLEVNLKVIKRTPAFA